MSLLRELITQVISMYPDFLKEFMSEIHKYNNMISEAHLVKNFRLSHLMISKWLQFFPWVSLFNGLFLSLVYLSCTVIGQQAVNLLLIGVFKWSSLSCDTIGMFWDLWKFIKWGTLSNVCSFVRTWKNKSREFKAPNKVIMMEMMIIWYFKSLSTLFNPCPAEPGYTLPLQTV